MIKKQEKPELGAQSIDVEKRESEYRLLAFGYTCFLKINFLKIIF